MEVEHCFDQNTARDGGKEGVAAVATAHVAILWTCTAECEARDRVIGWQTLYL